MTLDSVMATLKLINRDLKIIKYAQLPSQIQIKKELVIYKKFHCCSFDWKFIYQWKRTHTQTSPTLATCPLSKTAIKRQFSMSLWNKVSGLFTTAHSDPTPPLPPKVVLFLAIGFLPSTNTSWLRIRRHSQIKTTKLLHCVVQ